VLFTKRLREGIRRGRIRCSIRIWTRPHVRVGGRYRMDEGHIVVDSIAPIAVTDVTYDLPVNRDSRAWRMCCESQDMAAATRCT